MSLPGEIEDMKQRMLTGLCSPLGLTCVHVACSHCLVLAWLLDCLELDCLQQLDHLPALACPCVPGPSRPPASGLH